MGNPPTACVVFWIQLCNDGFGKCWFESYIIHHSALDRTGGNHVILVNLLRAGPKAEIKGSSRAPVVREVLQSPLLQPPGDGGSSSEQAPRTKYRP